MKKIKFVVISYQRTGSTFLVLTLNKLEGVICHSELFNRGEKSFKDSIFNPGILPSRNLIEKVLGISKEKKLFKLRNKNPEKFLHRIFTQDEKVLGFKLFTGQNDSILESLISDREVKKILLGRENLLRCYVSKQVAVETGRWSIYKGEKAKLKKIVIDADKFITFVKRINNTMNNIKEKLNVSNQRYLDLTFEDITSNFPIHKIGRFLELDHIHNVPEVNQKRQNPFPLHDMIINYDELSRYFKDTEFEKFLID